MVGLDLWTEGLMLLAQAAGEAAPQVADGADEGGLGGLFRNFSFPMTIAIIGILFYLLLLRPERKRAQEMKDLLSNLKSKDRVITSGGVIGIVTNVQKDVVTLRIDDNTNAKMRVLRSAISRIVPDDEAIGEEAPAKP